MPESVRRRRAPSFFFPVIALLLPAILLAQAPPAGQGGGRGGRGGRGGAVPGGAPGAPPAGGPAAAAPAGQRGGAGAGARAAAPVDLTGYWVSIVTEDWVERMCPDCPRSGTGGRGGGGGGGFGGGGGRGQAPAAAAPAAAPEPCRAYAAGGSLRVPTRLNITWADDNTLKIEMDAGTQTRLIHFNPSGPAPTEKTLQGYSVGTWEVGGGGRGGRGGAPGGGAPPAGPRWGSLNVVTTQMKGGYLLSNRSNYSENAVLTEYFSKHSDFGVDYFTVTAQINDGNTIVTSSTFKKEPNGSKFAPTGCEIAK